MGDISLLGQAAVDRTKGNNTNDTKDDDDSPLSTH